MREIWSKLTVMTLESSVFNVKFEQNSHIILVFPLFTEQMSAGWLETTYLKITKKDTTKKWAFFRSHYGWIWTGIYPLEDYKTLGQN